MSCINERVEGTYVMQYNPKHKTLLESGSDTIIINKNHTYAAISYVDGRKVLKQVGVWESDKSNTITLINFDWQFDKDQSTNDSNTSYHMANISRNLLGMTTMTLSSIEEYTYRKVK